LGVVDARLVLGVVLFLPYSRRVEKFLG